MSSNRRYPKTVSGPFEAPPEEFVDQEERSIEISTYNGLDSEFEAVVEMDTEFDPSDRA